MFVNGYDAGNSRIFTSIDDGKSPQWDMNCDGMVNGQDLDMILSDVTGPCELLSCTTTSQFDRNADGDVDLEDYASVMCEFQ